MRGFRKSEVSRKDGFVTLTLQKFPTTPHLAILGDADVRTDKVLSATECTEFLCHEIVVEEKVDGANLGISFDKDGDIHLQNRGSFVSSSAGGQWKKLEEWLSPRTKSLFSLITDRYILFGEWCYAQHSVFYEQLPDWFLGFDLFDKSKDRFLACDVRDDLFVRMGINGVPLIAKGQFSLEGLVELLSKSRFGNESAEGLYLRFDEDGWLGQRAKLVDSRFIQAIELHWSRAPLRLNHLRTEVWHDSD